MQIVIKYDDSEIKGLLGRLSARAQDMTPAMRDIGEMIRTSVNKNFKTQGRPNSWAPSKRALKEGGETLTDKARLRRSFTREPIEPSDPIFEVGPNRVTVGANVIYARIHQLGGQAGRGLKVKIPARPFLMIQEEDRREMVAIINDYLTK